LRLGVVRGNARAERYWESLGLHPDSNPRGMQMGKLNEHGARYGQATRRRSRRRVLSLFRAIGQRKPEPGMNTLVIEEVDPQGPEAIVGLLQMSALLY